MAGLGMNISAVQSNVSFVLGPGDQSQAALGKMLGSMNTTLEQTGRWLQHKLFSNDAMSYSPTFVLLAAQPHASWYANAHQICHALKTF